MLSKSYIKLIKSLKFKKFRDKHSLFVIEGEKITKELLKADLTGNNMFPVQSIFATPAWLRKNREILTENYTVVETSEEDIEKISFLSTPQKILVLAKIHDFGFNPDCLSGELTLVLDTIQDPGNLGTIIRIAHWYGIPNIICSPGSADLFNPKTIQATMGSFLSVRIFYKDLHTFLKYFNTQTGIPIYGTFLSGSNIYTQHLESGGLIVLGNESQGISEELIPYIRNRLYIPSFSAVNKPDSLNVAFAAAIVCSEFRRKRLSSE
jgi:TrmH family RNA methyltransferase